MPHLIEILKAAIRNGNLPIPDCPPSPLSQDVTSEVRRSIGRCRNRVVFDLKQFLSPSEAGLAVVGWSNRRRKLQRFRFGHEVVPRLGDFTKVVQCQACAFWIGESCASFRV
jgi:hypothetical protein